MALLPIATLASLLWTAGPTPGWREAMDAYQAFDDAHAIAAFKRILAANPPSEIAAKAHVYLGLIAFNAIHPDVARSEFKKAIQVNPAVDLPPDSSPKATMFFAEARRELTQELSAPEAKAFPATPAPSLSPQPAVADLSKAPEAEATPRAHSHVLAFTLGGVAVAAGVVAVVGGIQVANYNGLVASANQDHGSVLGSNVAAAQTSANFWRYGWIAFTAGAAVALTAGVLTW